MALLARVGVFAIFSAVLSVARADSHGEAGEAPAIHQNPFGAMPTRIPQPLQIEPQLTAQNGNLVAVPATGKDFCVNTGTGNPTCIMAALTTANKAIAVKQSQFDADAAVKTIKDEHASANQKLIDQVKALQTALATANTLLAATAKDTKAAALAATAAAGTAKTAVDAAKLNKVALEANVKLAADLKKKLDLIPPPPPPHSCLRLLALGNKKSGLYDITLLGNKIKVWCDMVTQGGGWTLLMKTKARQRYVYDSTGNRNQGCLVRPQTWESGKWSDKIIRTVWGGPGSKREILWQEQVGGSNTDPKPRQYVWQRYSQNEVNGWSIRQKARRGGRQHWDFKKNRWQTFDGWHDNYGLSTYDTNYAERGVTNTKNTVYWYTSHSCCGHNYGTPLNFAFYFR